MSYSGQPSQGSSIGRSSDWVFYVTRAQYQSTTTIAAGDVHEYTFERGTLYRYITTAVTGLYPTEDSFYENFDGTTLTDIIASR